MARGLGQQGLPEGVLASIRDGKVEVVQVVIDGVGEEQGVGAAAVLARGGGAGVVAGKVLRVPDLLHGMPVVEGLRRLQARIGKAGRRTGKGADEEWLQNGAAKPSEDGREAQTAAALSESSAAPAARLPTHHVGHDVGVVDDAVVLGAGEAAQASDADS